MALILTATRVLVVASVGYACTTAMVALSALLLSQVFGMARSEAVVLAAMSGIVLYLGILLWGFAEQRLARVWALLLGGAAAGHGLVHWFAPLAAARIATSG
jgi:hypothetical protein